MSESKNDNSGCFFVIALICGIFVILYILGQATKEIGGAFKEHPDQVMMWVFIIGAIAYIIYRVTRKK